MSFLSKYKASGQVLIAVVFLLVNAGFTSILHSCLMEEKECCELMMTGGSGDGDHALPLASTTFNTTENPCCENTIIGGLTGISAPAESKNKTEIQNSTSPQSVADPFSTILRPAIPASHQFITQHPVSPPTREIYILTSSLLI